MKPFYATVVAYETKQMLFNKSSGITARSKKYKLLITFLQWSTLKLCLS